MPRRKAPEDPADQNERLESLVKNMAGYREQRRRTCGRMVGSDVVKGGDVCGEPYGHPAPHTGAHTGATWTTAKL